MLIDELPRKWSHWEKSDSTKSILSLSSLAQLLGRLFFAHSLVPFHPFSLYLSLSRLFYVRFVFVLCLSTFSHLQFSYQHRKPAKRISFQCLKMYSMLVVFALLSSFLLFILHFEVQAMQNAGQLDTLYMFFFLCNLVSACILWTIF